MRVEDRLGSSLSFVRVVISTSAVSAGGHGEAVELTWRDWFWKRSSGGFSGEDKLGSGSGNYPYLQGTE